VEEKRRKKGKKGSNNVPIPREMVIELQMRPDSETQPPKGRQKDMRQIEEEEEEKEEGDEQKGEDRRKGDEKMKRGETEALNAKTLIDIGAVVEVREAKGQEGDEGEEREGGGGGEEKEEEMMYNLILQSSTSIT